MKKIQLLWAFLLVLLVQTSGLSQVGKYLVLLRDKANSPYSVSKPDQYLSARSIQRRQKQNITVVERDLPVNPGYVTQIQQTGAKVWYTSRWLNAALVEADDATLSKVKSLTCVQGLAYNWPLNRISSIDQPRVNSVTTNKTVQDTPLNYGDAATQVAQIGADKMHQQGYHGEGMLIGILDAGFKNASTVSFLKPVFDEKRVLATYDFVNKETSVYEDDTHGLEVLSAIAATVDGKLYGTAYKASFILLRTEDAATEKQIEEANWLFGAEYADSAGVDIISSSLGYSTFEDSPAANYTYQNMDGKTALCTRAAQIATQTGMVVVVAAGNEGADTWKYITAPSDAASVLAIGAVTQSNIRASFSSVGPSADGRIKPDLAARGQGDVLGLASGQIGLNDGTSFAAPLVAGLVAGFWQAYPGLTATQITESLRKSGSQYATPDNLLGYGIPNFDRAVTAAKSLAPLAVDPASSLPLLVYPNPFSDQSPLSVQLFGIPVNTAVDAALTDLHGRVIWQKRYTSSGQPAFELPNIGLANGVYVMTIVSGDRKHVLKVVKQ